MVCRAFISGKGIGFARCRQRRKRLGKLGGTTQVSAMALSPLRGRTAGWLGRGGGDAGGPSLQAGFGEAPKQTWRGCRKPGPWVLTFREIWNRSFCRPLEQLVDVITEFPNEVEYIFRPSCVSLQRCGGCCGDEGLRCVPVETSTVTMQLLKIKPNGEAPYVEMAFTEHKQCECRPRQDLMRLGRRRPKGRGKRRQDKKRRKDCELCGTPRR
ncbi:PREDICTED: placenta growth factor [Nipponia nippon]|uniref:placenta growth factor n=1 Tax=Nipponia nippon TaxID=128390 RepID=UPI000511B31B|nr:PREDICTED: placenta growth factor [Nipponia nippon]